MKSIQVMLAGRSYPVKVSPDEESLVLRVVKDINEKIKRFQMNYQDSDKQDCMSMALLTYAVEYHKLKDDQTSAEIEKKLDQIDQAITQIL